jgi:type VI secretion system protein ImpC
MGTEASRRGGVELSFTLGQSELRPRPPLRIGILADFGAPDDRAVAVSRTQDLDEVMQAMAPELDVFLDPSPIESAPPLSAHLSPRSLVDLSPAGLIAQVPALTALYVFRERLALLAAGTLSPATLESELAAYAAFPELSAPLAAWAKVSSGRAQAAIGGEPRASAPADEPASAGEAAIERILDMVSPGTAAEPRQTASSTTGIGQIIADIAKPRRSLTGATEPAVSITSSALSSAVGALLHHPGLQALESVWRGLGFLRRRTAEGCELVLINAPREGLVDAYEQRVRRAALARSEAERLSLVVLHHPIRRTAVDIEQLRVLAQWAEAIQVPLIVRLADDFFGAGENPAKAIRIRLDSPELQPWNALRGKDCARWVVATFNPFLLRPPYSAASTRDLRLSEGITHSSELLWGHPGWLLLERLVARYADTGWPTGFEGMQGGCVTGLELHEHPTGVAIPLRYPLGPQDVLDLAEHGVTAPACEPNRDRAYLLKVPMVFAQPPLSDRAQEAQSRRMMRLDYQLVAADLASTIGAYVSALPAETALTTEHATLEAYLRAHVASAGPDAQADVSVRTDASGRSAIEVTVRLGPGALGGVPIQLTLSA